MPQTVKLESRQPNGLEYCGAPGQIECELLHTPVRRALSCNFRIILGRRCLLYRAASRLRGFLRVSDGFSPWRLR
jgi:hypothetical protein